MTSISEFIYFVVDAIAFCGAVTTLIFLLSSASVTCNESIAQVRDKVNVFERSDEHVDEDEVIVDGSSAYYDIIDADVTKSIKVESVDLTESDLAKIRLNAPEQLLDYVDIAKRYEKTYETDSSGNIIREIYTPYYG